MKLKVVIAGVFIGLTATACGTVGHAATPGGAAPASHTASVSSASGAQARGSSAATSAHVATTSPSAHAAATSPATASEPVSNAQSAGTEARTLPVLFDCLNHPVVKPSSYIFTCADDGSFLYYLKWTSWTSVRATAVGVHELNDCTPNCAEGKFRKYPAVITFWRPEALAGHPGEKYFTRVTVSYTGPRPPMYMSYGQLLKNPASWTEVLGS